MLLTGLKPHHSYPLMLSSDEKCRGRGTERNDKVFRAHWWEVLYLVKKLPVTHLHEIIKIMKDPVLKVHIICIVLLLLTIALAFEVNAMHVLMCMYITSHM